MQFSNEIGQVNIFVLLSVPTPSCSNLIRSEWIFFRTDPLGIPEPSLCKTEQLLDL